MKVCSRGDDPIGAFWLLLTQRSEALLCAANAGAPVYDELLVALQRVDAGLYLEFSTGAGGRELVVTADGDELLFAVARRVVSEAPQGLEWSVAALRPRRGFPEAVTWDGVRVPMERVSFEVVAAAHDGCQLDVRFYVAGVEVEQLEAAHNGLLRALDHGLGEAEHAALIRSSELLPLSVARPGSCLEPVTSLSRYVSSEAPARS